MESPELRHPAGRTGFAVMAALPAVMLGAVAVALGSLPAAALCAVGAIAGVQLLTTTAVRATIDRARCELEWDTVLGTHRTRLDSLSRVRAAPLNRSFLLVDGAGLHLRLPPAPGVAAVLDELTRLRPDLPISTSPQVRRALELDRCREA